MGGRPTDDEDGATYINQQIGIVAPVDSIVRLFVRLKRQAVGIGKNLSELSGPWLFLN